MRQAVSVNHKIRPTTQILFYGAFPRQVVFQAVSRDRLAACLVSPIVRAVSRRSAVFPKSAMPLFLVQATPTHLVNYLSLKVSSYYAWHLSGRVSNSSRFKAPAYFFSTTLTNQKRE